MTYETPSARLRFVDEALEALGGPEGVLLTTHVNADGDGAGCEVAMAAWLRARGQKAWIINPTPFPASLRFLLPNEAQDEGWVLASGSKEAKEAAGEVGLAVILDTGEASRIGSVLDLVRDVPKIVIDHHPPGPDPLEGISFRDPEACATGELVFDLLKKAGGPWPSETVRGLYVALLTDTGSFRFSNTTPDTHRIVAFLIARGADPEELYRQSYGNVPLRKIRLLHAALAELEVDPEGDVAWMTVPTQAFNELGATADDIEGLVDYPREIKGVEVGLLFRETARGDTKVSFRSNGNVDVNVLARQFGGGGHVKASGAVVGRPLVEARDQVLDAVRSAVRREGGNVGE
jgi:phosphoesterase RecJ-like protein